MELAKMEILSKMDEGLWLTDVYILTKPLVSPTETIKQSHSSYPYNPIMAEVLYRTTFLESWGSGASRIMEACKVQNVSELTWSINGGFICVTFVRPITDPMKMPVGLQLGLNSEQVGLKLDPSRTQVGPKLDPSTAQVVELLSVMEDKYYSISQLMEICGKKSRKKFRENYILPALDEGALERKYPNSPNHPRQQYKLTEQALEWKRGQK